MTALNELLKAMRGGALPPEDSWLALVRHQDQIVAHIWPAGSNVSWDGLAGLRVVLRVACRAGGGAEGGMQG